jgi:hypothetical protein
MSIVSFMSLLFFLRDIRDFRDIRDETNNGHCLKKPKFKRDEYTNPNSHVGRFGFSYQS